MTTTSYLTVRSNCCHAPIHPVTSDEGTSYYVCSKCDEACDPEQPTDHIGEVTEKTDSNMPEEVKTLTEIEEALKDKPDYTQVETDWGHFKSLITQAKAQAYAEGLRQGRVEERQEKTEVLESLCDMWNQYCSPPQTHANMTSGQNAELILDKYGLLKADSTIDWEKLESLEERTV